MVSEKEFDKLVEGCRTLRPSQDYSEDDYIRNVFLTVLDFQMPGQAVKNAISYYERHNWSRIRTHQDLVAELAKFPDDEMGTRRLARHLWGNEHWVRAALLRRLVNFFERIGATTQERLRDWVTKSDFHRDFEGRIRVVAPTRTGRLRTWGLGYAVDQWLRVRLRIETVKPDSHLHDLVRDTIGRNLGDQELVALLEEVAKKLGLKAYELDWRIWEYQRGGAPQ